MWLLSGALAFRFLLEKKRLQILVNPREGSLQAFALIDDADVGFDGGGVAGAGEELIAGEARLHLGIHLALLTQDETAYVEFQNGIANPGVFAQALGEIEVWG